MVRAITRRATVFLSSCAYLASLFVLLLPVVLPTGCKIAGLKVIAASDSTSSDKAAADYVCGGLHDEMQIQAAIDALPSTGGRVVLLNGDYIKGNAEGISVRSNVEIVLAHRAVIELADHIDSDACIFTNSDMADGNNNIHIHGGTLDGNEGNQTEGYQYGFNFARVDSSSINTRIQNFRSGDAKLNRCNVDFTNLAFTLAQREVLFGFETSSPTQPTMSFRGTGKHSLSADAKEGKQSLLLSIDAAENYYVDLDFDLPVDLSHRRLTFWMKPTNVSRLGRCSISRIWTSTSPEVFYWEQAITCNYAREEGKWTEVLATATPDKNCTGPYMPSTVRRISFKISNISKDGPLQVLIDNLVAEPVFPRPIAFIGFDDNKSPIFTNNFPAMNDYGFKGIAFTNMSSIGQPGFMTMDQLGGLDDAGWDIASHLYEHKDITLQDDATKYELMVRNRNEIEESGFAGSQFLATPWNKMDSSTFQMMRRVHSFWRGDLDKFPYSQVTLANSADDFANARSFIDLAFKYHEPIFIWGHGLSGDGLTAFGNICGYLTELGFEVKTLTEFYTEYLPQFLMPPMYQPSAGS